MYYNDQMKKLKEFSHYLMQNNFIYSQLWQLFLKYLYCHKLFEVLINLIKIGKFFKIQSYCLQSQNLKNPKDHNKTQANFLIRHKFMQPLNSNHLMIRKYSFTNLKQIRSQIMGMKYYQKQVNLHPLINLICNMNSLISIKLIVSQSYWYLFL